MYRKCFVIQPFDDGPFDKRYKEIFDPAIRAANFEPYRVDKDYGASIPIESIEQEILNADVCFADITLDNPNVWFELGYAIAKGKEICIVCSDERNTPYPFDIRHRHILNYSTQSISDYAELKKGITARLEAIDGILDNSYLLRHEGKSTLNKLSEKQKNYNVVSDCFFSDYELSEEETACIGAIADNIEHYDDNISVWLLSKYMKENTEYNQIAINLGTGGLVTKRLILVVEESDEYSEVYKAFKVSEQGWRWIVKNKASFALKSKSNLEGFTGKLDEEIPF